MDNLQLRSIVQFSTQQPDKKAKEREMRMLIAKDMAHVLTECNNMTVRWKASKTDLMEALHWTWMNDTVAAADGSPCLFRQLVTRACNRFGITEPRNPRCLVTHALMRKGMQQASLCRRCAIIAATEHTDHPLMHFISID